MKIVVDRKALLGALDLLKLTVRSRTPSPLLTCVKIVAADKSLLLSATDAEVSLSVATASVDIHQGGELAIPLERLASVMSGEDAEPTVTIESADNEIVDLRFTSSSYRIFGYIARNFPAIPQAHLVPAADKICEFTCPAKQLWEMLRRVDSCVSAETSRYAVAGILISKDGPNLEIVATDGRRLAVCQHKLDAGDAAKKGSAIIPSKACAIIKRICEEYKGDEAPDVPFAIRVMITSGHLLARVGDYDFVTSLVEGSFPPFRDVVPSDAVTKVRIVLRAKDLRNAVRRAAIMASEETRALGLCVEPDTRLVRLWAGGSQAGSSSVNFKLEEVQAEAEFTSAYNHNFLLDAAAPFEEGLMTLQFAGPSKPLKISNDPSYVHVVMPCVLPPDMMADPKAKATAAA